MLLVDAAYIHNGGGRVLLNYLIMKLLTRKKEVFFLLDSRCKPDFDFIPTENRLYLETNLWTRYRFYATHKNRFTKIICLGNLAPPIKLKAEVYTYFQNLILIDKANYQRSKNSVLTLKKWLIRAYLKNTDYVCVQTDYVRDVFCKTFKYPDNKCLIFPFFENFIQLNSSVNRRKEYFLYVSDGNRHKNHRNLLMAWELVNQKYPNIELHLTVSEIYPQIVKIIKIYQSKGMNVINHGRVSQEKLNELYQQSEYIIYPSFAESLGLGLIEGVLAGCKPIVANLPYIFAVVEPFKIFNPLSFKDIADEIIESYDSQKSFEGAKIKVMDDVEGLIDLLTNSGLAVSAQEY